MKSLFRTVAVTAALCLASGAVAGGTTWAPQTSGAAVSLYSVHFAADAKTGWAVGSRGTIIATSDGGTTWAPQTSGTEGWLNSVHFAADAKTGWAVGYKGTIVRHVRWR